MKKNNQDFWDLFKGILKRAKSEIEEESQINLSGGKDD